MLILSGGILQPPASAQQMQSASGAAGEPWQSQDVAADQELSPAESVQVHSEQGIRYISGGVGEDERLGFKALSNQFNLRLLFAMQGSGDYLAAVQVNILDAHGETILSVESEGPWFFAQLTPGNYTVEVTAPGPTDQQSQRKKVHILGSRQSQLNFYWR